MKIVTACLVALALASLVSGCAMGFGEAMDEQGPMQSVGFVYTHTRQPLTLDLRRTRVVDSEKSGDIKHISLILPRAPLPIAAWDSAAIGDIAKKNGLTEVYSADVEIFSILQIWNQYTVHVYGK